MEDALPGTPRRIQPRIAFRVVGIALGLVFTSAFLYFAVTSRLVDLAVYRLGGAAVLDGADPYARLQPDSGLPFTYTPFAAALFAPISLPPPWVAQTLWTTALLVSLYFFGAVSMDAVRPRPRSDRRGRILTHGAVAGFALLLEPVRNTFSFGQINTILALMIMIDLFGRLRLLPRGTLVGIAAGIKLTPLIFLPYLLCVGRWRDAVTGTAAFCVTVAVGFAVSAGPSTTFWTHTMLDADHVGGVPYVGNQSLLGVLSRLLAGQDQAQPFYLPIAGLLLVTGLAAAVFLCRTGQPLLGASTCALTGLLVSPVSWSHHWVWLLPLLLCLFADPARPPWGRAAALTGYSLAALAPIWWVPRGDNVEFTHNAWQTACANSYFAAALGLLAALLLFCWRRLSCSRRGWGDPHSADPNGVDPNGVDPNDCDPNDCDPRGGAQEAVTCRRSRLRGRGLTVPGGGADGGTKVDGGTGAGEGGRQ
ncbi:glycosyltransferase 87 family protein [Parafrankia sp. EUN1f]|uniref:glycosyltransferase 87 family protein n=1 Tax=Parafrankia sp. EUN1f TaxID=102897 RepID=UPI0001C47856|nr:glycosyltransferase 87 family protein [Parafrankia sp. EUN1f]EFC79266.1 hypothetical protein FrEUN1fDRAFT_7618 [Parafrankia sp. EUN1f]